MNNMISKLLTIHCSISLLSALTLRAETVGAYWTFQAGQNGSDSETYSSDVAVTTLSGSSPVLSATGSGVTNFANFGSDFTGFDSDVWLPGRALTWNAAASGGSVGNTFQITFDSNLAENFSVRLKYRNNGTMSDGALVSAFSKFEYNVGSGFLAVPGADLTLTNNQNFNNEWSFDLSSLAAIENVGSVTLRWNLPDFDQISGTQLRVDDVQVTAQSLPSPPARARSLPVGNYNVLFISIDDLKPLVGAYGMEGISTPHLDSFSQSSVTFTNAHCQQAICTASRASVLTGLRPDTGRVWDLTARFREITPNVITIPQHFKNNGYTTWGVGKVFHGTSPQNQDVTNSWSDGWDPGTAPFRYYESAHAALEDAGDSNAAATDAGVIDRDSNPVTDLHYDDGVSAAATISQLQNYAGEYLENDTPFFMGIGFRKPHLPFACPKSYWDLYDPQDIDLTGYDGTESIPQGGLAFTAPFSNEPAIYSDLTSPYSEAEARRLIHGYMACVSYVDQQVGLILNKLDELGLADSTIVVIWGDHGFHLADHGAFWSKHSVYEQATRVPLLVRAPGMDALQTAGSFCHSPVELVDLFPTLVDLCSLPVPLQPAGLEADGTSFLPLLEDVNQPWKKAAFSQFQRFISGGSILNPGQGMGYSIRTNRYRYTEWWRTQTTNQVNGYFTDRHIKLFSTPEFVELYDYQNDPNETANLAGDPAYSAIVTEMASVLLEGYGWESASVNAPLVFPLDYHSWSQAYQTPGISLDPDLQFNADPDSDGMANIFEYKMGTNPLFAESDHIQYSVEEIGTNDYFSAVYQSIAARDDVTLVPQASSTLLPGSFSSNNIVTEVLENYNFGRELLRARFLIEPNEKQRFMRLSAEQIPVP